MSVFNSLQFDGVDSLDNGVYITGEAVYNTPERDVEMISIPGRNGSFALDKGRFENIDVTYPAGAFGNTQAEFAKKMRAFRNLMASRTGYKRLVDTYNPDEFRLGVFRDAIETKPVLDGKAGEFSLVFNCKPQRFLMAGETALSVTTGDNIFNPTMFDAKPMLEVNGYGDISIGGKLVSINNVTIGNIRVASGKSNSTTITTRIDTSALQTNDVITLEKFYGRFSFSIKSGYTIATFGVSSESNGTGDYSSNGKTRNVTMSPQTFAFGTSSNVTASVTFGIQYTYNGSTSTTSATNSIKVAYNGSDTFTFTVTSQSPGTPYQSHGYSITHQAIYANSTKSALGNPTYIDLDIGAAWNADGGTPVSLNNAVSIPSIMPVLSPGNTTITFDNTITALKIVPRWWVI